jgi:hypothetical protein
MNGTGDHRVKWNKPDSKRQGHESKKSKVMEVTREGLQGKGKEIRKRGVYKKE